METLQAKANPVNSAVKSLLRELDSEIRRLTDEHADILAQPVPDALLKHLLYYIARARDLDSEEFGNYAAAINSRKLSPLKTMWMPPETEFPARAAKLFIPLLMRSTKNSPS